MVSDPLAHIRASDRDTVDVVVPIDQERAPEERGGVWHGIYVNGRSTHLCTPGVLASRQGIVGLRCRNNLCFAMFIPSETVNIVRGSRKN